MQVLPAHGGTISVPYPYHVRTTFGCCSGKCGHDPNKVRTRPEQSTGKQKWKKVKIYGCGTNMDVSCLPSYARGMVLKIPATPAVMVPVARTKTVLFVSALHAFLNTFFISVLILRGITKSDFLATLISVSLMARPRYTSSIYTSHSVFFTWKPILFGLL